MAALRDADAELATAREALYDRLIVSMPMLRGKELSAKEREEKGIRGSTLVYGEIKFRPYFNAIMKIKRLYGGLAAPGGKFYDIGSGTGKPVFAAALAHPWDSCVGIEILESLHAASLELLAAWGADEYQRELPEELRRADIRLICGDVTVVDWSDGDVFFANSTCFDDFLMAKLAITANRMKVGAYGITFTRKLPSDKWEVLESQLEQMSWGGATVFIQRKVA